MLRLAILFLMIHGLLLNSSECVRGMDPPEDDPELLVDPIWAAARLTTTDEALLDFFRKRTPPYPPRDAIERLAKALGDKDPKIADAAHAELVGLGVSAAPVLYSVGNQLDASQASRRARQILPLLQGVRGTELILKALQVLKVRKPAGAAEALLNYLPYADNVVVFEKVESALVHVGIAYGKADVALLQALNDPNAARRAEAAVVLCRADTLDDWSLVEKLLDDRDKEVRRRVALEMISTGDKKKIALTLTGLLEELSGDRVWEVEEALERLAQGTGPSEIESDPVDWRKAANAWRKWWRADRKDLVMVNTGVAAPGVKLLGYRLLVQKNAVSEMDADSKQLWSITGLSGPLMDATILPRQRVLIVEADRVTERNFQGKILWQRLVSDPVAAQRLRNGNTLIACDHRLLEVDRDGKEVLNITLVHQIRTARKLPNGKIFTYDGLHLAQVDRIGRDLFVLRAQAAGDRTSNSMDRRIQTSSIHPEILDNGGFLSTGGDGVTRSHSFTEYDPEKGHHSFLIQGVGLEAGVDLTSGFRLPNGHTLVVVNGRKCVELDEELQPIRETTLRVLTSCVKGR